MALPSEYLELFQSLRVHDPGLGISCTVEVSRYISGMPDDGRAEYEKVLGELAIRHLKVGYVSQIPNWFKIPNSEKVPPYEEFTREGLRRAYGGRASHDELRDALRLACLVGRCKPDGAAAYGQKWFGLDCNAFVGNYQGIAPSASISSYVNGYGKGKIPGATQDVNLCRDLLPLPPIARAEDIVAGTVLVTFRPDTLTAHGDRWGHIALVESLADAGPTKKAITIVEWGSAGGTAAHVDRKAITLERGDLSKTIGALHGKKVFYFWDKGKADLRIFLDASGWDQIEHRGYRVGMTLEH